MKQLIFNGKSTKDFGVWISGGGTWSSPERDVEHIEVPGRNGDLTIDNGRFKNVVVSYESFIPRTFDESFDSFRAFLFASPGYHRLEDDYHPDEFRMAEYFNAIEPEVGTLNRSGKFTLEFNCKPQRFLKNGETVVEFSANGQIMNPTLYASKPLLRVYGTGTVGIGGQTVQITSANVYTDIDCDIKDAFKGSTNCNGNIVLASGDFPVLNPGTNGITLGSGITKIEITPRWYTI